MGSYTDEERANAVALYVEHGLAEAHHRTGIPKPTLKRWLTDAGLDCTVVAERSVEQTRAATQAHVAQMAKLRVDAQREFARSAVFAATKVRQAEKGNDAQGWATAAAISIDKLRLELGEVTDRTEVRAPERTPEQEAEMAKVVSLADRRAA